MQIMMISFGNRPDPVWLILGAVAVAAVLWWSLRTARGAADGRRRAWLLTLRLLTAAVIVFCLLDPYVPGETQSARPGNVVILLDTSRSMEIEEDGVSRLQQARDWLAERWSAPDDFPARLYGFNDGLTELEDAREAEIGGERTALLDALAEVADAAEAQPVSSILVISDGADTGSKRGGDAVARLARLGVPVHALLIGSTNQPPDVWIEAVSSPLAADRRASIEVGVTLNSPGFAGQIAVLHVRRDGRSLVSREVTLAGRPQRVDLQFAPGGAGFQVFAAEIEPLPGERLTANNQREFGLTVTDSTLRVLYMEASAQGRGDMPELFFLKHALEDEPGIEVRALYHDQRGVTSPAVVEQVAFLDPRSGERIFRVRNSRRGYPKSMEELLRYHVIICSDIPRAAFSREQMEDTVRFVEEFGGGFVMVGGDTAFGAGRYDQTPIEKILPVEVAESRDNIHESFEVQLAPGALLHPIMRLLEEPEANAAAWAKLPPFMGFNRVDRAKPGATVLWQHPSDENRHGPRVILGVQQIGKGRSMAFATDTTFSWGELFQSIWGEPLDPARPPSAANNDARYYKQFWVNAVRWLSAYRFQDEQMPVRLALVQAEHRPGEEAPFIAEWLGGKPPGRVNARAELLEGERVAQTAAPHWDGRENLWRGGVTPEGEGRFVLRFSIEDEQGTAREVNHLLHVRHHDAELADVRARGELLADLARDTGGVLFSQDSTRSEVAAATTGSKAGSIGEDKKPIWDSWVWLALIVGLLTTEWIVRRTGGLA